MTILIDADGCPVIDETIELAVGYHGPVLLLCDTSHRFERAGAQTFTVSKGADSVDFALAASVRPGDIVVTQDYGLAAMCLARGALVVHQDGWQYTDDNIDALLSARYATQKIWRAGGRIKVRPRERNSKTPASAGNWNPFCIRQIVRGNDLARRGQQ